MSIGNVPGAGSRPGADIAATATPDTDLRARMGAWRAPARLLWSALWLFYLAPAVGELVSDRHTPTARVLGSLGLALVTVLYLVLTFAGENLSHDRARLAVLAVMWVDAVALTLSFGSEWVGLFVYVAVASAAALPLRSSRWAVLGCVLSVAVVGLLHSASADEIVTLVFTSGLAGGAMMGIRRMLEVHDELRQTREMVAHLAANEERLRLARDLHDLLGHSLSLITLKSELAGRLLPGRPEDAARQVAEIEQVGRQALVDVREAVSGYRRPTLAAELAGARIALDTAGVRLVAVPEPGQWDGVVSHDAESALAWVVREAVTNVLRHSNARTCRITVRHTAPNADTPATLHLHVCDDGHLTRTVDASGDGNGLSGLRERLALIGGTLDAGPPPHGDGFQVVAAVPLADPRPGDPESAGRQPGNAEPASPHPVVGHAASTAPAHTAGNNPTVPGTPPQPAPGT